VICADHIGPLPIDEEGYQYILVLICAFSRWIEQFPPKTITAEETARCIHQHVGRIRTDNGPAFANDLLKGVMNLLGSTNEFTTAYSSEENDIVERANKEVLRHLRALEFERRLKAKWSLKTYNSTNLQYTRKEQHWCITSRLNSHECNSHAIEPLYANRQREGYGYEYSGT